MEFENIPLLAMRLRNARQLRGLTLDELAGKVGLNKSTVQRYEKGRIQAPKQPVVRALASALDVNYAWLCGKSETVEPVDGDEEITRCLEVLEKSPEMRSLFKTMEGADPEEVRAVVEFLRVMRGGGRD